jgi:hypothetical protein
MATCSPRTPLDSCSACGSRLVAPWAIATGRDGRVRVTRRCPDCRAFDEVAAEPAAAALWFRDHAVLRARRAPAGELPGGDAR